MMESVTGDRFAIDRTFSGVVVSVKTLRAYHEAGMLVPADVDPRTGYRSYSAPSSPMPRSSVVSASSTCRWSRSGRSSRPGTRRRPGRCSPSTAQCWRSGSPRRSEPSTAIAALKLPHPNGGARTHEPRAGAPARHRVGVRVHDAELLPRTCSVLLDDAATGSGASSMVRFGACYPPLLEDDARGLVAFVTVDSAPRSRRRCDRTASPSVSSLPRTSRWSSIAVTTTTWKTPIESWDHGWLHMVSPPTCPFGSSTRRSSRYRRHVLPHRDLLARSTPHPPNRRADR